MNQTSFVVFQLTFEKIITLEKKKKKTINHFEPSNVFKHII